MSKKTGRALAALGGVGVLGALASRFKRKGAAERDAQVKAMKPAPPAPTREREPLRKLQDNLELKIQEDRFARGVPAVTDEEQADMFKGIRGVRSETGVPIRSGDGLLQTEYKKGGKVKSRSSSGASKRGDGIAQRGKTKGRFI